MTINIIRLHAAAFYFTKYSRNAAEIAAHVGVHARTITRWAELPEWDRTLDTLGYSGDREFEKKQTRNLTREQGEIYHAVKDAYFAAAAQGIPQHKWGSAAEKATGAIVDRFTIRRWAKMEEWKEEIENS